MGFPDSFKIPVSDTRAYRLFGNSVVIPIVEKIASNIVNVLVTFDSHSNIQDTIADRMCFNHIEELARQNTNGLKKIYPDKPEYIFNTPRLFEKSVLFFFKNILNLRCVDTAPQKKWDGEINEDGEYMLWECKTSIDPYNLPLDDQRQIIGYIKQKRDDLFLKGSNKDDLRCFIIVSSDFKTTIIDKMYDIQQGVGASINICFLTARNIYDIWDYWKKFPRSHFDYKLLIQNGFFSMERVKNQYHL